MLKSPLPKFPDKLALLKRLPCTFIGWHDRECGGVMDPAHFRYGLYLGANIKDDMYALSACRIHHSHQHNVGEKRFYGERIHDAKLHCLLMHIAYLNDDFYKMTELTRDF